MRHFLRAALAAACLALSAPVQAQGQGAAPPSYYPPDYNAIVEGSKKENKLVVYSIMAEYNWKPVLEGFKKLHPWIDVQTLDLGSSEVFERYYAERGSNAQSADLLINGAVDKWLQFVGRNEILDYKSPEAEKLPKWSLPRPGLYTVSADPMVIVYNKALVPEKMQPKSMQDLADLATKNAGQFKGKITTYNAAVEAFGLAINWAYVKKKGEGAWQTLEALGKVVRSERSAGPMVEKLTTGEYAIGYWISGIVFFPKLDDPARARLLGWTLPSDGTPIVLRGMAIPKGSTNVNAAKLMLDYILSHDGQVGFGKGGLTPYREDVKDNEVPRFTFQKIAREVGGEDKLVIVEYDEEMLTKGSEFQARWRKAFGL